jgi:hypothetical protein
MMPVTAGPERRAAHWPTPLRFASVRRGRAVRVPTDASPPHRPRDHFVEAGELSAGGDREQLVGEIHEHAVVARGVVGEGDAKLARS